jgi:hypothetical protein
MRYLGLTLLLAQAAGAEQFYQDFRGKEFNPEVFRQVGPSAAKLVKQEPEGLRITLSDEGITTAVGVAYPGPLEGDFQATAGYELLRLERPRGGFGAGFSVYVTTAGPAKEAVEFFHLVRPSGAEAYGCSALMTGPDGRRVPIPGAVTADVPAQGKSGRLRVTRVGPEVSLSAAEGKQDFKGLYRINLGTADVTMVRLAAHAGNAPNPIDLRVLDFRLQHKDIAPPAEALPKRSSLWLALLLVLLLLLATLLMWLFRRRAKKHSAVTAPNR